MNIRALGPALRWAAKTCADVAPSKGVIPSISGMMLRAVGGHLHVEATDITITTRATIEIEHDINGQCLVDASRFAGAVSAVSGDDIRISLVDGGTRLHIRGSTSGKVDIPTMDVDSWPAMPEQPPAHVAVVGRTLAGAIDKAKWSMATASLGHEALEGVRLVWTGYDEIEARTTTGRAVSVVKALAAEPINGASGKRGATIAPGCVPTVLRQIGDLFGKIELSLDGDHASGIGITGKNDHGQLGTCIRPLGHAFPEVAQIFPDDVIVIMRTGRERLVSALKGIQSVIEAGKGLTSPAVRLTVDKGKCTITARDNDTAASWVVECEGEDGGRVTMPCSSVISAVQGCAGGEQVEIVLGRRAPVVNIHSAGENGHIARYAIGIIRDER